MTKNDLFRPHSAFGHMKPVSPEMAGASRIVATKCLKPVLVALVVISCSGSISQKDVIGTYSLPFRGGKQVLTLYGSGVFVQQVDSAGSPQSRRARGRWKFDPTTRYVTLDQRFLMAEPLKNPTNAVGEPIVGDVMLHAERGLGGLRLVADEDHSYKKDTP